MINTDYMFENIVGQDAAKGKIAHYHRERFQRNGTFPNVVLTGGKGNGKTELAKAIGRGLYQVDPDTKKPNLKSDGKTPLPRSMRIVNASTIKSVEQMLNSLFIPHVVDKEVTVFFDEAHNFPPKVVEAMLTMFQPDESNRSQLAFGAGEVLELDFNKQVFILATTDAQKIAPPLFERFKPIELEDYNIDQLAEIMHRRLKGVEVEGDVLTDVATTVRGNARMAVDRAKDLQDMVTKTSKLGVRQWNELKKALSILPLGVNALEMQILRILQANPNGTTLTSIGAQTGLSAQSIQKFYEIYLQKLGLMEITAGKGRTLTPKGTQYLRDIDNNPLTK